MDSNEKICPYCVNGGTMWKVDFLNHSDHRLYVRDDKVYFEDEGKLIHITSFYFCPFCGRPFKNKRLGKRKFKGEI